MPVNSNTKEVTATFVAGDIEIGAVEIKNATDDTRAVVKTDGVNNALVVTQNSQPLPAGAATQASLATVAGDTTSIDGKTPVLGVAAGAASVPVALSTEDAAKVPSLGAAAAAASVPVTLATEDAAKVPALGAAASAASSPVVLASDDAQLGALGAAADVDGSVHGQLRHVGESVASVGRSQHLGVGGQVIAIGAASVRSAVLAAGLWRISGSGDIWFIQGDVTCAALKAGATSTYLAAGAVECALVTGAADGYIAIIQDGSETGNVSLTLIG